MGNARFWVAGICIALLLASAQTAAADSLDAVVSTVALLRTEKVETIQYDGQTYEIYLKPVHGGPMITKTQVQSGTGFFVLYAERLFLVTAQHVALSTSADTRVTLRTTGDRPVSFSISALSGVSGPPQWVAHDSADIAALRLNPSPDVFSDLQQHFIPQSMLVKKLAAPPRDRLLTTLGFPLGLGADGVFSPISNQSKPASGLLSLLRFDTQTWAVFFLLDSPSVGGFSGAPVFDLPGVFSSGGVLIEDEDLKCVGVVHGTISDDTGGKMAAVHPAELILETLQKALTAKLAASAAASAGPAPQSR